MGGRGGGGDFHIWTNLTNHFSIMLSKFKVFTYIFELVLIFISLFQILRIWHFSQLCPTHHKVTPNFVEVSFFRFVQIMVFSSVFIIYLVKISSMLISHNLFWCIMFTCSQKCWTSSCILLLLFFLLFPSFSWKSSMEWNFSRVNCL